jgi:protein-tyrosine-phosphatase
METNLENGVVDTSTQTSVETQPTETKQSSFDADAFFKSLSERADKFFTNSASKQLEEKYGMSEDEIKTLINEHKNSKEDTFKNLQTENENLKNEILNMKKNSAIEKVLKELNVKEERKNHIVKLADLENILNEDGSINSDKVKNSFETVLKDLPEFIQKAQEPDFGNYQKETKQQVKDEDLFNFNFTKIK